MRPVGVIKGRLLPAGYKGRFGTPVLIGDEKRRGIGLAEGSRDQFSDKYLSIGELLCNDRASGGDDALAANGFDADDVVAYAQRFGRVGVKDSKVNRLVGVGGEITEQGSVEVDTGRAWPGDIDCSANRNFIDLKMTAEVVGRDASVKIIPWKFVMVVAFRSHVARGPDVFLRKRDVIGNTEMRITRRVEGRGGKWSGRL